MLPRLFLLLLGSYLEGIHAAEQGLQARAAYKLCVVFGRRQLVLGAPGFDPSIHFIACDVQAGFLKVSPRREGFLI